MSDKRLCRDCKRQDETNKWCDPCESRVCSPCQDLHDCFPVTSDEDDEFYPMPPYELDDSDFEDLFPPEAEEPDDPEDDD